MNQSAWLGRVGTALTLIAFAGGVAQAQTGSKRVSFVNEVLPIFQAQCARCHNDGRGGLKLDTFAHVMKGGSKGKAIVAGKPQDSLLIQRIEGTVQPRMPLGGKRLPQAQILLIRKWISEGARDDSEGGLQPFRAEQPLSVSEPQDGQQVQENVLISIPRAGVPPEGFIAIYIDDRFIVAKATPEDLPPENQTEEEAAKPTKPEPITYVWDSKAPLSKDTSLALADRMPQDGPHVIEVRAYDNSGSEIERVRVQVELQNQVVYESTQPLRLAYRGQVGDTWRLEHVVDLKAEAGESAYARRGGVQRGSGFG